MKKVSKKSKRRLLIFGMLSIVSIGYFFVTLFGYTYNFISLKNEEAKLQNQLVSLQDKKANLKVEIQKLNDPEYVARYAKENYLYSEDGEYVLKIDNSTPIISETSSNNYYYLVGGVVLVLCVILLLSRRRTSTVNKKKK